MQKKNLHPSEGASLESTIGNGRFMERAMTA